VLISSQNHFFLRFCGGKEVMVVVVHPAGKVRRTSFEHITIFYDIFTTCKQSFMVYTIVVDEQYYI